MDYRTAILAAVGKIEKAFTRDDLQSISRGELAALVLDVYDLLTESTAPAWWERDADAEHEQRERILTALQ